MECLIGSMRVIVMFIKLVKLQLCGWKFKFDASPKLIQTTAIKLKLALIKTAIINTFPTLVSHDDKHFAFISSAEEILASNKAIWMSNDGHLMLYGVFNDTNVMEQKFSWYGSVNENGNSNLYPETRSLR